MTLRDNLTNQVAFVNLDKILFPEVNITKGELIEYYARIADWILPYLYDRPISMQRFPDGVQSEGFYQKACPKYFPSWLQRVEIDRQEQGPIEQVLIQDVASLVYLANQAVITPHAWLSRMSNLDIPDRLILDLDPPDHDFEMVRTTAFEIRDLLNRADLPCFCLLTGSRGVHLVIPLVPCAHFDDVRETARRLAAYVASRHDDSMTTAVRKDARQGRLFIDYLRNAFGQTAVTPYAVRARPKASVAVPLDWAELRQPDLASDRYSIKNVFERLEQMADPWKDFDQSAVTLDTIRKKLALAWNREEESQADAEL